MNNESTSSIISRNGDKVVGTLTTDIIPIEDGKPLEDNDNPPDDPFELCGNSLSFIVYVKEAKDLPENFCKEVQVEYECFYDKGLNKTKINNEKSSNPIFEENFEHKIDYLQKEDIEYLLKENVK